jgi:hypothetical protein
MKLVSREIHEAHWRDLKLGVERRVKLKIEGKLRKKRKHLVCVLLISSHRHKE